MSKNIINQIISSVIFFINMLQEQPQKDIFQMSTHYNQFHGFESTFSEPSVNTQYKQFILKAKSSILAYTSNVFQQIKNQIIRQEISRINPFYTSVNGELKGVGNLRAFVQNLLSFYRKSVQKIPINSLLIQQTQEFLEEVGDELEKRREELLSDSDVVKNIQRTSYIVKKTVQKFIECLESRDLRQTQYVKYGDILKCLLGELQEIVSSSDFLQKIVIYDPYGIPTRKDPLAQTIKEPIRSPRSYHSIKSEKSTNSLDPHFHPKERIHFNKDLTPSALDFIYPKHHRVYICEAAKAYSEIVPSKINKINVDRYPKYTNFPAFQIDIDDYFSGEETLPMIYHLIPNTTKMSFYKLQQMSELLSLTREYENIKEVPMENNFSEHTLSCISPYGTIFITNSNTVGNNYDLSFWQYKFNENSMKKRVSIPTPRKHHGMVFLNNFVFLIGGSNSTSKALKTVDRYNVKKKQWTAAGELHVGVIKPTTCVFRNRYILSCCGLNEFDFISNRFEIYDSIHDGWTILKTAVNLQQKAIQFLNGGSAVAINSDVIYIFGGERNTNFQHDTDFGILINEVTEVKKKPSRVSADLIPTGGEKRVILSFAGNFKPNSAVIHENSIYFLRKDIF